MPFGDGDADKRRHEALGNGPGQPVLIAGTDAGIGLVHDGAILQDEHGRRVRVFEEFIRVERPAFEVEAFRQVLIVALGEGGTVAGRRNLDGREDLVDMAERPVLPGT